MKLEFKNITQELEQNKQFLKDFLQDEIIQKGIVKTGTLANSVRVEGQENKDGLSYFITMKDYGYFQDAGVNGTKERIIKDPKSYFDPGQFRSIIIGGNLPFPVRRAIANKGIKARPFIQSALDRFEELTTKTIESEGIKDIDDTIEGIFVKQGAIVK